jgi:hypothetical protein
VALNLWKVGGMPTSYNPLPIGFTNASKLSNMNLGDFIIRLRAKSVSNAKLRLQLSNGGNFLRDYQLSNTFTFIEVSFTNPSLQNFYLNDLNSNGDIIIDSIELVQKPMPKLTVNGVDGFTSEKWSLNSNATVIDDETLQINFNGTAMNTTLLVNILPNSTYTLRFDGDGKTWVDTLDASQVRINNKVGNLLAGTFTMSTESNAKYLSITFFGNVNGQPPGIFTYKRPMLNLGSTPAPYSRKTGDKMVLPVVKKNLINTSDITFGQFVTKNDGSFYPSASGNNGTGFIPIKPNTQYTPTNVKANGTGSTSTGLSFFNASKVFISSIGYDANVLLNTFLSPSNAYYVKLTLNELYNTAQLEEGTLATAYTPYAVQTNKLAKRYVPKKNLVSNAQGDWEIGSGDPNSNGDTTRIRMKNRFDVKVGNSYMVSWSSALYDVYLFDSTAGSPLGWYTTSPVTFSAVSPQYRAVLRRKDLGQMSVSEIINVNIQIEQGYVATSYEPYTQLMPKASTGLKLNGTSDYGLVPSASFVTPANLTVYIDVYLNSYVPYPSTSNSFLRRENSFILQWTSLGQLKPHIYSNGSWRLTLSSNNVLKAGYRYRLVMTYDGTSLVGYVDGVEVCRTTYVGSIDSPNNDLFLFKSPTGGENLDGTVYSTKIFSRALSASEIASLNNNTALRGDVLDYNFEKPSNIVGSTVLQNAQNLIPSFEDTRWRFDLNYYSVMGKNALTSKVPSAFAQTSIVLDVKGGQSYLMAISYLTKNARYLWETYDVNGNVINSLAVALQDSTLSRIVSFGQNVTSVKIMFDNVVSGSFDFIKPQLYQLDGKEATISGTPTALLKQSRRSQYAKR